MHSRYTLKNVEFNAICLFRCGSFSQFLNSVKNLYIHIHKRVHTYILTTYKHFCTYVYVGEGMGIPSIEGGLGERGGGVTKGPGGL